MLAAARRAPRGRSRAFAGLLGAVVLGLAGAAHADLGGRTPRLPQLLRQAVLVVRAEMAGVSELDEGRLLQGRLRVLHTLKGKAEEQVISVVEEREFPSVPATLAASGHGVAFLARARMTSELRRALEERRVYRLVAGRWGWIALPAGRLADEVLEALGRWTELARGSQNGPGERAAERRALVFFEIGASHPRLVEDGAEGLRDLPGLAGGVSSGERQILIRAIRRRDLPERIRRLLVEVVAEAGIRSVASHLRNLPRAHAPLLKAAWAARRKLGDPPDPDEIAAALRRRDPEVRAAAAAELLESGAKGAADAVGRLAREDPSRDVRIAAIDSLGNARRAEALPVLRQIFADGDREIRQRSARAIYRIGGRPAAEVLTELAFEGPPEARRYAVVVLMTMGLPAEDPLLVKIRDTHPDPAIRDLVSRGLR